MLDRAANDVADGQLPPGRGIHRDVHPAAAARFPDALLRLLEGHLRRVVVRDGHRVRLRSSHVVVARAVRQSQDNRLVVLVLFVAPDDHRYGRLGGPGWDSHPTVALNGVVPVGSPRGRARRLIMQGQAARRRLRGQVDPHVLGPARALADRGLTGGEGNRGPVVVQDGQRVLPGLAPAQRVSRTAPQRQDHRFIALVVGVFLDAHRQVHAGGPGAHRHRGVVVHGEVGIPRGGASNLVVDRYVAGRRRVQIDGHVVSFIRLLLTGLGRSELHPGTVVVGDGQRVDRPLTGQLVVVAGRQDQRQLLLTLALPVVEHLHPYGHPFRPNRRPHRTGPADPEVLVLRGGPGPGQGVADVEGNAGRG